MSKEQDVGKCSGNGMAAGKLRQESTVKSHQEFVATILSEEDSSAINMGLYLSQSAMAKNQSQS